MVRIKVRALMINPKSVAYEQIAVGGNDIDTYGLYGVTLDGPRFDVGWE